MVCVILKRKAIMSDLGAINSSNIAFGSTKVEEKQGRNKEIIDVQAVEVPAEKKASPVKKFITQPIQDEFHKAYGEDAEATPSLVADFVSDNLIKAGVAVAGGAAILAKARKSTSGLTEALKAGIKKVSSNADDVQKTGVFKRFTEAFKSVTTEMKRINFEKAKEAVEEATEGGGKIKLGEKIKSAILQPKEFEKDTKLAGVVDKVFGKHAQTVKNGLGKVGIGNGSDLADTAIAVGSTAAISAGVNEIADDVTEADNDKLAIQGKIKAFEETVNAADKIADTLALLAG